MRISRSGVFVAVASSASVGGATRRLLPVTEFFSKGARRVDASVEVGLAGVAGVDDEEERLLLMTASAI